MNFLTNFLKLILKTSKLFCWKVRRKLKKEIIIEFGTICHKANK